MHACYFLMFIDPYIVETRSDQNNKGIYIWKPKIIFHMSAVFRSPKRGGGPKRTLNAANRGPRLPNHPLKVLIGAVLPYSHLNPIGYGSKEHT